MMVKVLGIDLGKNTCSLAGLDASGGVVLRRRVRRDTVLAATAKLAPCVVAMEACCGAHHLARQLAAQGHEVRLMSPDEHGGGGACEQAGADRLGGAAARW